MNTYVIGDIHGAYLAFKQVLQSSKFDYEKDRLICLGDVVDGWSQTKEVIEELKKIKNLILIRGNHDDWVIKHEKMGMSEYSCWQFHGGSGTLKSYVGLGKLFKEHIAFLIHTSVPYYFDKQRNTVFTHGGFDIDVPIEQQSFATFMWDRELITKVHTTNCSIEPYNRIFVGHTIVQNLSNSGVFDYYAKPIFKNGLVMMDTGAGYGGCVSMLNLDSNQLFQSAPTKVLYPNETGRS